MDGIIALQLSRMLSKRQRFKQKFFYPQDFGAKADGVSDDLPAIMAALAAASTSADAPETDIGGSVIFAPGDYRIDGPILPEFVQSVHFGGMGRRGLRGLQAGGARILAGGTHAVVSGWWNSCEINNLCLDNDTFGGIALDADLSKTLVTNNELINWVGYGMRLCSDDWKDDGQPTYLNRIENNHIQRQDGMGLWANYLMWDSWIRFNNIGSSSTNIMTLGGPHKIMFNWLDGAPGPDYNIHCENVGHTHQIIGNYLENCNKNAILLERDPTETGDRRLSFMVSQNQILNGGHSDDGDSAVKVVGNSLADPDGLLLGLTFNGNQFFDDADGHWTYALDVENVKHLSIVGNDWSNNGYTAAKPMRLVGCEDFVIAGNVGGSDYDTV